CGEKRFANVVPLARRFGAALVVGCIDEKGQASRAEDKLGVAVRSRDLLTGKYGVAEEDLYFDPLVFPCASGDAAYTGSAMETIEAVRLVKAKLPRCKTVLGISNVSFGLPSAGREVVNSVFLYHCVQAGLDLAIVNAEKLERYPSIPESERALAEGVLRSRDAASLQAATQAFTGHFREKKPQGPLRSELPLDERLARYIVEGSRDGLHDDLAAKLAQGVPPLEIINGPLIQAVREHNPDVVGLSGLLVKSAQQMVATASDLRAAGVDLPLLVGGAALSRNFVDRNIAPAYGGTVAYAHDAMSGLELAKRVVDAEKRIEVERELAARRAQLVAVEAARPASQTSAGRRSSKVPVIPDPPRPPDLERHVITNTPLDQI